MKKIILLGLLILVCLGLVYWWGSSEAKGRIVVSDRFKPKETTLVAEKFYRDDYLEWNYPGSYELRKIETTDGRVITNVELLGVAGKAVHYTITLRNASQELADFSAVQFRRSRPDQYTEGIAEWGERRGLLFTTEDNKEKTIFFREKDKILTVSMTANSNDPELDKEFKKIWQGILWKQI